MPARKHLSFLLICVFLCNSWLVPRSLAAGATTAAARAELAAYADPLDIEAFLAAQPGLLKQFREADKSAAALIADNSLYYGLSPRLLLALLEACNQLLSDPAPAAAALQRPFGSAGPPGFAAQLDWASRTLRAGLGPYERPPNVYFTDGTSRTLRLDQAPEGVAVQRLLAMERSSSEWQRLVERFNQAFVFYFNNELPDLSAVPPPDDTRISQDFSLLQPWPAGVPVIHLAYFDHAYPTVDSGPDGNSIVVNYLGRGDVQYNSHDGHDYVFPDLPVGTPILAAAAGMAYARTHRGNGVVIRHSGGYETVYWHLDRFAALFAGRIDANAGVYVAAGTVLGTSGRSGFVQGTPHLHFEVRHYGRQVDPYGWQGAGPDPCLAYAGCAESRWLWDASLNGSYNFHPPASQASAVLLPTDTEPPSAAVAFAPPADLRYLADFDDRLIPQVGQGFPSLEGQAEFRDGRFGRALHIGPAMGLTLPLSDNIDLAAGTLSFWANLPEAYPPTSVARHYLFAASANAFDEAGVYSGTMALRRELSAEGVPLWNFWTTPEHGAAGRHALQATDTLGAGWHHFAVTWDARRGRKGLYIDGRAVALTIDAVQLPGDVGPLLHLGRFTYGGQSIAAAFDELMISARVLSAEEIADLAMADQPFAPSAERINGRRILLDTNALDDQGGVVAVQIGRDGEFGAPQAYYDRYRWNLPAAEGSYELAVRFYDRAGNVSTIRHTLELDLPPQPVVTLVSNDGRHAVLSIVPQWAGGPLEMQISEQLGFAAAEWQPFRPRLIWQWRDEPRTLYLRLRDTNGQVGPTEQVLPQGRCLLPLVTAP
jgi:murein DD-endopeptidase MepM/ murein hydrolase activator NlpD